MGSECIKDVVQAASWLEALLDKPPTGSGPPPMRTYFEQFLVGIAYALGLMIRKGVSYQGDNRATPTATR